MKVTTRLATICDPTLRRRDIRSARSARWPAPTSPRSAARRRPRSARGPRAVHRSSSSIDDAGPNARVKSDSRSRPDQGGVTSSTRWPSDSSSAAASRAAASHSGSSVERRRAAGSGPARCAADPARRGPVRRTDAGRRAAPSWRRPARSPRECRAVRAVSVDRPRQDAIDDQEALADVGPDRDAAARRLEPDEAAAGGRDPDRAAAVVAVSDRHHPGRDRRARSRRSSRPGCGRGPTGCGWGRNDATRWWGGSPSRAARSCRRSRTRRRAAGGPGTHRGRATKSPNRSLHIVNGIRRPGRLSLIAIGTPANGRGSPGAISARLPRAPTRARHR